MPVNVTMNVPVVVEEQLSDKVAGTLEVAGSPEQESAAGTVVERATVAPVSPLALASATFELADPGAGTCGLVAARVKSGLPTLFAMFTVPAKPLTLAVVAIPVPVFPTGTLTAEAGPVIVKSPTETVNGTRWNAVQAVGVPVQDAGPSVTLAVTT